jgi:hypothetical protein
MDLHAGVHGKMMYNAPDSWYNRDSVPVAQSAISSLEGRSKRLQPLLLLTSESPISGGVAVKQEPSEACTTEIIEIQF